MLDSINTNYGGIEPLFRSHSPSKYDNLKVKLMEMKKMVPSNATAEVIDAFNSITKLLKFNPESFPVNAEGKIQMGNIFNISDQGILAENLTSLFSLINYTKYSSTNFEDLLDIGDLRDGLSNHLKSPGMIRAKNELEIESIDKRVDNLNLYMQFTDQASIDKKPYYEQEKSDLLKQREELSKILPPTPEERDLFNAMTNLNRITIQRHPGHSGHSHR